MKSLLPRKKKSSRSGILKDMLGDYELSPFPGAILRAMEVIRDENSSLDQIAEALRRDPALSVYILRMVNSPAFGLRGAVDDLGHAVHLIGRSPLESLLISIGARRALPRKSMRGYDPRRFWRTAARRAATARALVDPLRAAERSRAFTAALLQDIAVPMLADHMTDQYSPLLVQWHAEDIALHEIEREAFGWDHALVGAEMCDDWDLPKDLASEIRGHHTHPDEELAASKPILLSAFIRESEELPGTDALIDVACSCYGMERDPLVQLLNATSEHAAEIASLLT